MNSLVLAYLGDALYELYVRNYLIEQKIEKVDTLQKEAIKYVSAKSQSDYLKLLLDSKFLSQEEENVVLRGRNHKGSKHPKNTDIITYKWATGLESLIGYLYVKKDMKRIDEIMNFILKGE